MKVQPSEADLAKTCPVLDQELGQVYARYQQLEAEERARSNQNALVGSVVNAGIGAAGYAAGMNVRSMSDFQAMQAGTQVASAAAGTITGPGIDVASVTSMTALAERAGQLERAKLANGCLSASR